MDKIKLSKCDNITCFIDHLTCPKYLLDIPVESAKADFSKMLCVSSCYFE